MIMKNKKFIISIYIRSCVAVICCHVYYLYRLCIVSINVVHNNFDFLQIVIHYVQLCDASIPSILRICISLTNFTSFFSITRNFIKLSLNTIDCIVRSTCNFKYTNYHRYPMQSTNNLFFLWPLQA